MPVYVPKNQLKQCYTNVKTPTDLHKGTRNLAVVRVGNKHKIFSRRDLFRALRNIWCPQLKLKDYESFQSNSSLQCPNISLQSLSLIPSRTAMLISVDVVNVMFLPLSSSLRSRVYYAQQVLHGWLKCLKQWDTMENFSWDESASGN